MKGLARDLLAAFWRLVAALFSLIVIFLSFAVLIYLICFIIYLIWTKPNAWGFFVVYFSFCFMWGSALIGSFIGACMKGKVK